VLGERGTRPMPSPDLPTGGGRLCKEVKRKGRVGVEWGGGVSGGGANVPLESREAMGAAWAIAASVITRAVYFFTVSPSASTRTDATWFWI